MSRHRITNRRPVRHAPIADALRETPGIEMAERTPAYAPAGSFTARLEDSDDGTTVAVVPNDPRCTGH